MCCYGEVVVEYLRVHFLDTGYSLKTMKQQTKIKTFTNTRKSKANRHLPLLHLSTWHKMSFCKNLHIVNTSIKYLLHNNTSAVYNNTRTLDTSIHQSHCLFLNGHQFYIISTNYKIIAFQYCNQFHKLITHFYQIGYVTFVLNTSIYFTDVFQQLYRYTLCFKKKFTLLLFAITKSDIDRFQ